MTTSEPTSGGNAPSQPTMGETAGRAVGAPSFYVDSFSLQATSYTLRLNFAVQTGQSERVPICQLLMSPQHAKMMALTFTRALREYERQIGAPIHIPRELLEEKGFDPDQVW